MHSFFVVGLVLVVIFPPNLSTFGLKAKGTESALLSGRSNAEKRGTGAQKNAILLQDKAASRQSQSKVYRKTFEKSSQRFLEERLSSKRQATPTVGFQTLKIAAFNVQSFGEKKMTSGPFIRKTLVNVRTYYKLFSCANLYK